MKNNPLVSIIIPVYNVELYLKRCVKSVINQTFEDWELILINDGSTDKSGEICNEMALIDSKIRIIHKMNEGVGKARNEGIVNAKGIYLCFVDSDDWLDKETLKVSTRPLKTESFDVIQFGCTRLTSDEKILSLKTPPSKKLNFEIDSRSDIISFFEAGNGFSVWGKLIKKSVIDDNNLFFGTKKRGQDIDFTIKLYS
jgi:glycosyltransferase involved in cell wall biosynthesis